MSLQKINSSFIKKKLPSRKKFSNKTDAGKVLVVGGGKGLYGAGILTALAATRSGAGYTHLMTDLSKFPWLKFPDFIVHPLKLSELKNKKSFVVAIGPGLGVSESQKKFLTFLIKEKYEKVILDADALTLLATMKNTQLPESWILTPHEGELARLLHKNSAEIKKDRIHFIQEAQKKFGCVVLLKGADTLISDSSNKIYQISEGTRALAKAGTGDTLLGIIAGFYAQDIPAIEAAILGSYVHGTCSKLWEKQHKDHLSLRPLDIIESLPKVLFSLR